MLHSIAPQHHAYRRPRATRRGGHDRPLPAIRRGSFMEHARQFPELYHAPAAQMVASPSPQAAIDQRLRPLRTPRTWFAAAVGFLTARPVT